MYLNMFSFYLSLGLTNLLQPTLCHRPLWSLTLVVYICFISQMSHVVDVCGLSCCSRLLAFYHKCHMSLMFVVVHVGCVYLQFYCKCHTFSTLVFAHVVSVYLHFIANVTCSSPARLSQEVSYRQALLGLKQGDLQLF